MDPPCHHVASEPESSSDSSPQAPPSGTLLFLLGMSFGLVSTAWAQESEVYKLRMQLEESEKKVRDLEVGLGLKDSLGTKDLDVTESASAPQSSKAADGDMSDIEAELEAQLELTAAKDCSYSLDEVMNTRKLDPEYEADYATGELGLQSGSDSGTSGASSSSPCSGNYVVSPKELSIRLHELIQSMLEARIAELRAALLDTQKRIHSSESELSDPLRWTEDEYNRHDLDEYNGEEFEEVFTMNKADDPAGPQPQDTPCSSDSDSNPDINSRIDIWEPYEQKSNNEDGDDELETLLIERLVAKARHGSPPIALKAKQMIQH